MDAGSVARRWPTHGAVRVRAAIVIIGNGRPEKVGGSVSGLPGARSSGASATVPSETAPSLRQSPGRVEVHLPSLDALLDRTGEPSYPHTSPMVERSVARFLLDAAREQRRRDEIEVHVTLDGAPLTPEAEVEARARMHRFFGDEAELAALDLRVNRSEGFGSMRYALPMIVVALLVAGFFYTNLGEASGAGYLEALSYLVFITIVWVMLWDPLEVLLFDSYMIRQRVHALRKLARAPVTFTYRAASDPGSRDEGARSG